MGIIFDSSAMATPCPSSVGFSSSRVFRVVSDVAVTPALGFGPGLLLRVSAPGASSIQFTDDVELTDLSVEALEELVEAMGVETSAQTASGLRRAIERHLED